MTPMNPKSEVECKRPKIHPPYHSTVEPAGWSDTLISLIECIVGRVLDIGGGGESPASVEIWKPRGWYAARNGMLLTFRCLGDSFQVKQNVTFPLKMTDSKRVTH